jgi:hypothetical protein
MYHEWWDYECVQDFLVKGNSLLARPRRKGVDKIKTNLGYIRWGDMGRIHLAQNSDKWRAVVNTVMNLRYP